MSTSFGCALHIRMARESFGTNMAEPLSSSRDEGDGNTGLYIILGGVALAVIFFLVALYWILRGDRLQRERSRLLWEAHLRTSRRNNDEGGTLSRQAGFQGLSIAERKKVLGEWLRRTAFEYSDDKKDNDADIKKGQGGDTATTNDQDDNESLQENKCSNACGICFESYFASDSVVTGTQCKHLFHSNCARQWFLSKSSNDNCPYCRVEILRPCEFRNEARAVLGETRFAELLGEKLAVGINKDGNDTDREDEASSQMEQGADS